MLIRNPVGIPIAGTLVGESQESTQAESEQVAQTFADSALENVHQILG